MSNNYIVKGFYENIRKYEKKDSYFSEGMPITSENKYRDLPEEYSVFSEIDNSWFEKNDTTQLRMVSECLLYIKKRLMELYLSQGVICILPKLNGFVEDDGTIVLSWAYSNYRIFFSFENEEHGNDSYYGLIAQEDKDSVLSQTKKFNLENFRTTIDNALQLVINNS